MEPTQMMLMKDLTENQKMMLQMEYKEKKVGTAYLFYFFLAAHKAYLGEWGKQFLYWFTLGGFFIWMIADLFRMKSLVKRANDKLFQEAIMKVKAFG